MWRAVLGIGNLGILVVGHDIPGTHVQIDITSLALQGIWPVTGTFEWPPQQSLDHLGGVFGLYKMLDQPPPTSP